MDNPKIFLTDYASYNDGTQFQFGHWVELNDFYDYEELEDYILNHFKEADKKSPLDEYGSTREEIMITDYEDFPEELYWESGNLETIMQWAKLEENEKIGVAFLVGQGYNIHAALDKCEDLYFTEVTTSDAWKWELFETWYPEAGQQDNRCPYVKIDYDGFIRDNFTSFDYGPTTYVINDDF